MTRAAVLEDPTAPDWTTQALAVLTQLASEDGRPINSDTLIAHGVPLPPKSAMWGNLFGQAARARIIRKVDYRPSARPSRRGGSSYTWQGCSA